MKIGLIAVGLNTYWHQFGGLRERLDGYRNAIKEKMEAYGGQIVADAGMVDDVDKAHAAAALFRRDEAEVLFIFISTYALSSTLIPFLGEGIPVVLLNLQPAPAIDYARLNGMSDRGEMTGEWLANCQACSLPEFCSVFTRAGTKYDVVTGYLDEAQAWENAWQAMDKFIEQDAYLSKHRGEYTKRNGAVAPFANQLDLSISHDIIVPQRNGREHKLRFSFNIDNFLNLLNRNWGVSYSQYLGTNGQQYQFLSVTQKPTAANDYTLQYKMTNGLKDIYGNDISLDRTYKPDIGSYWTMQFGIKYMF